MGCYNNDGYGCGRNPYGYRRERYGEFGPRGPIGPVRPIGPLGPIGPVGPIIIGKCKNLYSMRDKKKQNYAVYPFPYRNQFL